MTSLLIPLAYIFVDKAFALAVLVPLTVFSYFLEFLGKEGMPMHNFYFKTFGTLLRPHETRKEWYMVNGATWVLISATITILLFPKIIAITVFSILILSDMFAALIGRRYGKTKLFDKSLQGTSAFVVVAVIIVLLLAAIFDMNWTYVASGAIGGIVAGLIEAASVSLRLDDNLSIPISAGLVMLLFYLGFDSFTNPSFPILFELQPFLLVLE
ncbi:MAG: SEC59/DGK1/VTE5 family protein [Candidatus Kapaibacteriales bacterium]